MRSRSSLVLAAVAAVAAASSALAAGGALSPGRLILQRSDVPAGARRINIANVSGTVNISGATRASLRAVAYRFRNGARAEYVGSVAAVFSTAGAARRAFTKARTQAAQLGVGSRLRLPSLGDEQFALGYLGNRGASSVVVAVRQNRVIWETAVSNAPALSRARAIAETLKYARKQKARVGSG
jgi:hypothetical protein